MALPITSKQMTDGQKKQLRRFVEDATDRVLSEELGLDKDGAQQLIGRGGEFQDGILELARSLSASDQFVDEEVSSEYGYLSGYKPKGITEQTNRLRELFPGIGYADEELAKRPLSGEAEGWFAIPKWQAVAQTYGEAVEKALQLLSSVYGGKFCNYRQGQLGPEYLREHASKTAALQQLAEQQPDHDILVVACQFGLRHRGRSVRRAREVMTGSEFGLGAFEVAIMLLTHPERLQQHDDLWIDFPGDEYSSDGGGVFGYAPCFDLVGRLGFVAHYVDFALERYGSASAFLPQ